MIHEVSLLNNLANICKPRWAHIENQRVMTVKGYNPFFVARFLQATGVDVVTSGHILTMVSVILEEVLRSSNQLKNSCRN
jgi:hypothetical protein